MVCDGPAAGAESDRLSHFLCAPILHYVRRLLESGETLIAPRSGPYIRRPRPDGDLSLARVAVDALIADNLNLLTAFWDYGYSNPDFNADAVCPF